MPSISRCATALLFTLLVACTGGTTEGTSGEVPEGCGLPSPEPSLDLDLVPPGFTLEGDATVWRARRSRQGTNIGLNAPLTVNRALETYRGLVVGLGYKILSEDYEGFEAELYLQGAEDLGVVRIRSSACRDATVVYGTFVPR